MGGAFARVSTLSDARLYRCMTSRRLKRTADAPAIHADRDPSANVAYALGSIIRPPLPWIGASARAADRAEI